MSQQVIIDSLPLLPKLFDYVADSGRVPVQDGIGYLLRIALITVKSF